MVRASAEGGPHGHDFSVTRTDTGTHVPSVEEIVQQGIQEDKHIIPNKIKVAIARLGPRLLPPPLCSLAGGSLPHVHQQDGIAVQLPTQGRGQVLVVEQLAAVVGRDVRPAGVAVRAQGVEDAVVEVGPAPGDLVPVEPELDHAVPRDGGGPLADLLDGGAALGGALQQLPLLLVQDDAHLLEDLVDDEVGVVLSGHGRLGKVSSLAGGKTGVVVGVHVARAHVGSAWVKGKHQQQAMGVSSLVIEDAG